MWLAVLVVVVVVGSGGKCVSFRKANDFKLLCVCVQVCVCVCE